MSRTAAATPPQPYFPHRTSTPTMRHSAPQQSTSAQLASRGPPHQPKEKRKFKNLPTSASSLKAFRKSSATSTTLHVSPPLASPLDLSFEDVSLTVAVALEQNSPLHHDNTVFTATAEGYQTYRLGAGDSIGEQLRQLTPTPSMSASSGSASFVNTPLPTPGSSRAPSLQEPIDATHDAPSSGASALGLSIDQQPTALIVAPNPRSSWVPSLGKMAKAMVGSTGFPFLEKKSKAATPVAQPPLTASPLPISQPLSSPPVMPLSHPTLGQTPPFSAPYGFVSEQVPDYFNPDVSIPRPTQEELERLSPEDALRLKREWAEAHVWRFQECARLCSQWPQSGYNVMKFGQYGSKVFYEPQTYSNPQYVASVMSRQAELERAMCITAATFFASDSQSRRSSDDASTHSTTSSFRSSSSSPVASMEASSDDVARKTAQDISAAMASPLLASASLPAPVESDTKVIRGVKSLTELDAFASSMAINSAAKDDSAMDIDSFDTISIAGTDTSTEALKPLFATRPNRAQSCGAKRSLHIAGVEEEKRRKVDEASVVQEGLDAGVIIPPAGAEMSSRKQLSQSTPNLTTPSAGPDQAAVFGHIVKTSSTHPIIISPFFPSELLPLLSQHLIVPPASPVTGRNCLKSTIDVPAMLLSYAPQPSSSSSRSSLCLPTPVPSPAVSGTNLFAFQQASPPRDRIVGNLLLSSCPGKRLRMEGPIKGRGPVCRDLKTDLARIKGEGVGAIVCCLDDAELALLGVPWGMYREVACEVGLDIVRLPMPDGFTPVSLPLFDSQIDLLISRYSLQGVDVLVHCRGGIGRAGLTACAWAIKMGFVPPHPSLAIVADAAGQGAVLPAELEHQIVMSVVERGVAMLRSRRGLKAIESFEQVQFLASYIRWLRANTRVV